MFVYINGLVVLLSEVSVVCCFDCEGLFFDITFCWWIAMRDFYFLSAAVGAGSASPYNRVAVSSRQDVVTRNLKINEEISHIRSK
jgi:hypothetical protein